MRRVGSEREKAMRTICAIAFALMLVGSAHSRQPPKPMGQQTQQASQPAAEPKPPEPEKRGTDELPFVVRPDAATAKQRQEESDASQDERRKKAEADWWTIKTAIATAVILFIQAFVFLWQGVQLKRTVGATDRSVKTLQTAERSWLLLSKIDIQEPGWLTNPVDIIYDPVVTWGYKNFGRSPAFVQSVQMRLTQFSEGESLPRVPDYGDNGTLPSPIVMAIDDDRDEHFVRLKEGGLNAAARVPYGEGKTRLLFLAKVLYLDIFGVGRESRICMLYFLKKGEVGPHWEYFGGPEYNKNT